MSDREERKIVQIAVTNDVDIYGFCNDGTILVLDARNQWREIVTGPVPQPDKEDHD